MTGEKADKKAALEPAEPDPDDVVPVDQRYRCEVCGAEVVMTAANSEQEIVAPRHCREDRAPSAAHVEHAVALAHSGHGHEDDVAFYGAQFDDLSRVNPDTPGTKTTPATGFAPRYEWAGRGDMTLRATHGANYLPPLPDLTATAEAVERPRRANGMGWTEQGQPEALTQYGIVGQGTVYAAVATSVSLIMFSSQGIHRLAGTGGSSSAGFDWSQDQIDSSVSLTGPRALWRRGQEVTVIARHGGWRFLQDITETLRFVKP